MRRLLISCAMALPLLALIPGPAWAEVKTREKSHISLGGMIGKVFNMFGGKAADEGVRSVVALKGGRKLTRTGDTGDLIDLAEEKIYQILDYIDFLESKYAPKVSTAPNPLKRFAEGVEDTLRAGRMSAGVIGGTMNVMNKAVGVVTDVANAGKSVATEIAGVVSSVTSSKPQTPPAGPTSPTDTPPPPPPGDQRK